MDISVQEILTATEGCWIGASAGAFSITGISTDTRTIGKGDVFFALGGERFDGHDYLKEAYAKGVRCFVVSKSPDPSEFEEPSGFILVADTLRAYGDLAKFYRQKFKIPAIAITGSAGKTTVKELVAQGLQPRFNVLKNKGTENNLIGVPNTIFRLEKQHEVLVLEMGTSQPGEIDRLSSMIAPQIGIVTQIGLAHLDGLKSPEGIKEEKLALLNHMERGSILILNGQDPMLQDVTSGVHRIRRVGFSKEGSDRTADQVWCHEEGCSFYVEGELFETPLIGRHNVLNCLYAIEAATALGIPLDLIKKPIQSFKAVAGRMSVKNIDGICFLDDSYNSNPSSFRAALETLKDFKMRGRKGIVCGDMLELGADAENLHREMGALITELLFDFVIAAGPLSKRLVDEALKRGFDPKRIHHVKDSVGAGKICREIAVAGDRILIKGSRRMQMEKVFECFITSSIR